MIKEFVFNAFKGVAMGVANVIPGVSGGTIALITGIFERLIHAIKSFDTTAIKLLFKGDIKGFAKHTDLIFLISIFLGVGVAILTIARLFDYLFEHYPVYIWSYFFGLILASVYFVGRTVDKWNVSVVLSFLIGTAGAVMFTFMSPANENDGFFYLMICGAVAMCSMILPGLSGSFVLILMGNYKLIFIDAINDLMWNILVPVALGAGAGILAFSHLLSWLYKKFKNQTIALLTGFIMGSLGVIWPWKEAITESFGDKVKTVGYDFLLPEMNGEFFIAFAVILAGIASIWLMEARANTLKEDA